MILRMADQPFQVICTACKDLAQKGSDGKEHWIPLDPALADSEDILFSHGLCPRCYEKMLAELALWVAEKQAAGARPRTRDAGGGRRSILLPAERDEI